MPMLRPSLSFTRFLKWALGLAVAHYLLCFFCMLHFRPYLAYGESPESGWAQLLYDFTLSAPTALCSTWPVSLGKLMLIMILHSGIFGLVLAVVIGGGIYVGSWRTSYLVTVIRYGVILLMTPLAVYFVVLVMLVIQMVVSPYNTLVVSSAHLPPHTEKMHWLSQRIPPPGPVLATEFDIQSWSGWIGPCMHNCRIVVKVPPQDVSKWLKIDNHELTPGGSTRDCCEDSHPQGAIWQHISKPEYYAGSQSHVTVYRKEGILLFHLYGPCIRIYGNDVAHMRNGA